jgi:hypothetical protein
MLYRMIFLIINYVLVLMPQAPIKPNNLVFLILNLPRNEAYPSATLGSTLGQTCYPDQSVVISYEDHVYMMEEQT